MVMTLQNVNMHKGFGHKAAGKFRTKVQIDRDELVGFMGHSTSGQILTDKHVNCRYKASL